MHAHRPCVTLLLLVAVVAAPGPAQAQGAAAGPDLNLLALDWVRGQYGSPVVCQVENSPVRALRRVLIAPAPSERGAADRIQFPDPEAPGATRCFSELGDDEPRVEGSVLISLPGRSRPDTARYDFTNALRRDEGFRFEIRAGKLTLTGWGPGSDTPRAVEFAGGHAWIRTIQPGTDAERVLRAFDSPRKLSLELAAPDGTVLRFPLFQAAPR